MHDTTSLGQNLLKSAEWPHPVAGLELLETHISWVILTGEFAYKIKKPVKLEFLDFSTLELRRRWCHEELRLNGRWAPNLYLDVVGITGSIEAPVVGGDGPVIDYAVRMRQFPQDALLSVQLGEGRLDDEDMRQVAEMIADRHGSAPAIREERFGGRAAVLKPMTENFIYIREWLDEETVDRYEAWTNREIDRQASLIESRWRDGFVRECHGDLHLRNLVRLADGIVAFDCIEFSDELRFLDVISDLSFLSMDLDEGGRRDLAYVLLNRYLECSGDYAGMSLYALYFVYHCMIRAKVNAIRASERDDDASRRGDLDEMRRYCDAAEEWITPVKPALYAMHGYSGCGKSWVSSRLAAGLGAIRLRSDLERKRMHGLKERESSSSGPGQGLYDASISADTYSHLFELARGLVQGGHTVIIDAAFLDATERRRAARLAAELGVSFSLIAVEAPEDTIRRRLTGRQRAGEDASEAGLAVFERQLATADPLDEEELESAVRFDCGDGADIQALFARLERRTA